MPALVASSGRTLLRYPLLRARFVSRLITILGDTRMLWIPKVGDTTTHTTEENAVGRVVTYDADASARITTLKRGAQQTFTAASSQFGATPDTDNLSFNSAGTTDLPFTVMALVNVTDSAATRNLITKWAAVADREWQFGVTTTDALTMFLRDESAAVNTQRLSDGAITQGAWKLLVGTYSGVGGASAGDGITLYQSGSVLASSAINNVAYVAMENLTAPCEIGSQNLHTAGFMDGSMALVTVSAGALSAAGVSAATALCQQYFGVA